MTADCAATTLFPVNAERPHRPRLLLAYADSAHASRTVRYFRRLGWEVHMVASGAEATRLADELAPQVAVVDADLPDESGWLTAAKMLLAQPARRVLILAGSGEETLADRARSLGADLIRRDEGPEAIAAAVHGHPLSVAV